MKNPSENGNHNPAVPEREQGWTLLELLVVLAVGGILTALAFAGIADYMALAAARQQVAYAGLETAAFVMNSQGEARLDRIDDLKALGGHTEVDLRGGRRAIVTVACPLDVGDTGLFVANEWVCAPCAGVPGIPAGRLATCDMRAGRRANPPTNQPTCTTMATARSGTGRTIAALETARRSGLALSTVPAPTHVGARYGIYLPAPSRADTAELRDLVDTALTRSDIAGRGALEADGLGFTISHYWDSGAGGVLICL